MASDIKQSISRPVLRRLLIPLAAVLLLLVGLSSLGLLKNQQRNMAQSSHSLMEDVVRSLDNSLTRKAKTLTALEDGLLQNPELYEALQAQDRERLLVLFGTTFQEFEKKYSITHFYFHGPDKVNLVRIHKPKKYGDLIDRFTLHEAENSDTLAWGIELGPLGTLTLRVVQPVYAADILVGYLELGQEVEGLLSLLHQRTDIEFAVTINKDLLVRETWQSGMEMLGREAHWNRYREIVLIYYTQANFPPGMDNFIHDGREHDHGNVEREVQIDNKSYQLLIHPLQDASGAVVGDLLVLRNITAIKAGFSSLVTWTVFWALLLTGTVLTFYYGILRKTDQNIGEQYTMLQESEQKFRNLVESSNDWIWEVNRAGIYTYASPQVESILGYKPEELIGKTPLDLIPSEEVDRVAAIFNDLRKTLKPIVHMENVALHRNGQRLVLETNGVPSSDQDGKVTGYLGIVRDITERKRVESELLKSKEKWERTFDSFPDIVTLQDTDLRIIKVNQAACIALDLSCDALIGQHCYSFFRDSDVPCYDCPLLASKETFVAYKREMVHEKLGKTFLVSAVPVLDEQGKLEYIAHVAKDITDIKESEKDRVRLTAAIEQASEAVVITDAQGNIQYVNPAFVELTGYSREEVMGKNPRILKSGKQDQAFYKKMWNTLLQGETWKGHLTNEKKDGTLFEEEATISPVKDSKGKIGNFVAVKRDVSKEFALENQLRQSMKMEAVGTMAGGIAHDFNNILAAIIGYAEFIQEEVPKESRIGEDITEILAAGNRAADLVKQILTFSHHDTTEKQVLQFDLIVKEALKMLRATLPSTVAIQEDINPDCGTILAGSTNIHQIVVNLCTNGVQAMSGQKGTLKVSLQQRELSAAATRRKKTVSPGSFAVLTVSDSGCGMEPSTCDRIFEPYFTTKGLGKGTGLGLAVVHGIVQDCKGFIEVESAVGKGTTFSVYFPITEEAVVPVIVSEKKDRGELLPKNARILVVDDELLLVKINEKRLKGRGYLVTAVTDSREALKTFRGRPESFDLLVTDQTMPGLTGAELAKAVLKIKPSLPIIMCTGHSDVVSEEEAIDLGIKKYVFKPLHGDELLDAVQEVLEEASLVS